MSGESGPKNENSYVILPKSAERLKKLVETVTKKTVPEPGRSQSKKKTKSTPLQNSFKSCVLRVKRVVASRFQLGSLTVTELDNFIVHMIGLLEKELHRLHRLNKMKTLSLRDVETAVKICFPPRLAKAAGKFGKLAVNTSSGDLSVQTNDAIKPESSGKNESEMYQ